MRFRFGTFLLDDESFRLTCSGSPVALRRKVFDLLVVLVRERERVVSREELVERLWSTTAVGPGSLSGLVNELRAALGEGGRGGSSIRTVHARGYQFVAPVAFDSSEAAGDGVMPVGAGPLAAAARLARRDRLERARFEVGRSGARGLVTATEDPAARARWLAAMLAEARDAGFLVRWEIVAETRLDPLPLGEGIVASNGAAHARVGTPLAIAEGERSPIALGLEVREPGAWSRAGGLSRLLDLLGRAPVLVLAGLALPADDDRVRTLLGRDPRIEWAGSLGSEDALARSAEDGHGGLEAEEGSRADAARKDRVGPDRDRLTGILRALAGADEAAFLAALRAMGFEIARAEPIRTLRRVAPGARSAELRRHSDRI